jgi:hypothetical protein
MSRPFDLHAFAIDHGPFTSSRNSPTREKLGTSLLKEHNLANRGVREPVKDLWSFGQAPPVRRGHACKELSHL